MYSDNEYRGDLGCYQKWIHGTEQKINKLYCISAFHAHSIDGYGRHANGFYKYAEYLKINVKSIMENDIDAHVRVYVDESLFAAANEERGIWGAVIDFIKQYDRAQVICVRMPRYFKQDAECHQGLLAVMFRYLALFDSNVDVCLFRDLDNVWTAQHDYFVNRWLNETDKDLCLFLNTKYTRQQIKGLTEDGTELDDKHYNALLSGLWNIRKGFKSCSVDVWHKIFAYIESYTDFVFDPAHEQNKYFGVRFTYGFDELALTRVALPMFLNAGMTVYAVPIKIYDLNVYKKLFDSSTHKLLRNMTSVDISTLKYIVLDKYWDMSSRNAGLSQYVLCMISNMYFNVIIGNSFIKNANIIHNIKYRAYNSPILMGMGLFTFHNYDKYDWFRYGVPAMDQFLRDKKSLSFADLTANSKLEDYDVQDSPDNEKPNEYQ